MTETNTTGKTSPIERDRARRAARARARRQAAGAVPRSQSAAADLRYWGVNPNTHYSRKRRKRLRAERDDVHSVAYPNDGTDQRLLAEQLPPETHSDSYPSDSDGDAQRRVTATATEFEDTLARLRAAAPAALAEFSALDQAFRDADDDALDPTDRLRRLFQ